MRTLATIFVVMVTALQTAANAQVNSDIVDAESARETDKSIKDLRNELVAALKELTAQLRTLYQNARCEIDELLEARVQLIRAQLDAAENESDGLAFYKSLKEELSEYEKVAEARVKAARGTVASVLKVKARLLEAEIDEMKATSGDARKIKPKIVVSNPRIENVTITQQYVCQVSSQRHLEIRAPKSGVIESITAEPGRAKMQGDMLFAFSHGFQEATLNFESAETNIAQQELQNVQKLFERNVASSNELELSKTKLERAKAAEARAKNELDATNIRAPFGGIIDRLLVEVGSVVKEGESLTTLSDNSSMRIYFNMPESRYLDYLARPRIEKEVAVELVLANGSKFTQSGNIDALAAKCNVETGTVTLLAVFPNPDGVLRHGMTGNVIIHQVLNNEIVIPQSAAFEVGDKRYVIVIDKANVARRREIVVQHELDDLLVVSSGVGADDRILVEGTRQVQDGDKVKYDFRP